MNVAIFDFDKTMTDRFVSAFLMEELERAKIIKSGYIDYMKDLYAKYHAGQVGYNEASNDEFVQRAKYLDGVSLLDFQRFVEQSFDVKKYINPWLPELLVKLKEKGFLIIVVSGANEQFLDIVQDTTDFDAFFGSRIGIVEGKFTNSPDLFMNDLEKAKIIKRLIKESDFTIGFGDATGDVPMLKLLDKGFLYQPTQEAINMVKDSKNIMVVDINNILVEVEKAIKD